MVFTIIQHAVKIFSIANSGFEILKVYLNEDRTRTDVVNAVAHACFASLQTTDLLVRNTSLGNQVSHISKQRITTATAVFDIGFLITQKVQKVTLDPSKWTFTTLSVSAEFVSRLAMRVQDVSQVYQLGNTSPIFIGNCRKIENYASAAGGVAVCTHYLIDIYYNILEITKSCQRIQQRGRMYHLYAQGGSPVGGADRKKTTDGDQLAESEKAEKIFNTIKKLYSQLRIKDQEDFLEELKTVPEEIISPKDWSWHCSITNKPIRFIVRPAINLLELEEERSEEVFKICYEKEALERWMSEHIDQMPPNWPPEFWPVKQGKKIYIKSKIEQQAIDKQLCEKIIQVATEFGIHYKNFDNEKKEQQSLK